MAVGAGAPPKLYRAFVVAAAAGALVLACGRPAPAPSAEQSGRPQASAPAGQAGAAGGGGAPAQAGQRNRITLAYTVELPSMHPYGNSSSQDYARWSEIYGTLSKYDHERLEYVPNLAESWSVLDPSTWEIRLRQGVRYHNGNPFTADDVLFTFDRVANDNQSQQREKVKNIAEAFKVDDHTLRVVTKTPDSTLMVGLYNLSILDKETHDQLGSEEADRLAIGTGPYMLKEWVPSQRLVLERNPNYTGTPMPTIQEVVYRSIPEAESRITALLNGEVDVIFGVPPQHIDRIRASGNADVVGDLEARVGFIAMHQAHAPWTNRTLRLAVSHAIDREGLATGILGGQAKALYTPVGPNMIGYDPNIQPQYRYDPARAKQLVIEAGYPNGLDVELSCPVNRYIKDREVCEAIGSMLGQAGIRARLSTPEYSTFFSNIRAGRLPFYMFSRGSVVDPSEYLHQYWLPGATKRLEFDDPRVTELLLKERGTFDPVERKRVLSEVQAAIMESATMAFTYQYILNYGVGKRVQWKARPDEYMLASEMSLR